MTDTLQSEIHDILQVAMREAIAAGELSIPEVPKFRFRRRRHRNTAILLRRLRWG